jgi:catechol 2,3-dioxygenase-like lactoylglutathione lyase family enzyme
MNADTQKLGIMRLGQIAVPVHDVGRATAFYRDALGLPFLFAAGTARFFRLRRRAIDAR